MTPKNSFNIFQCPWFELYNNYLKDKRIADRHLNITLAYEPLNNFMILREVLNNVLLKIFQCPYLYKKICSQIYVIKV